MCQPNYNEYNEKQDLILSKLNQLQHMIIPAGMKVVGLLLA